MMSEEVNYLQSFKKLYKQVAIMKMVMRFLFLFFIAFFVFNSVSFAQEPKDPELDPQGNELNEDAPLDGIVEKKLILEKRVLPYQPIREADVMWEKRIWRVVDVREKMNLPFAYPEAPLFSILVDAVDEGKIRVFSDEKFQKQLNGDEVATMLSNVDTIITFDPETYAEVVEVVRNDIDPQDIKRYRIKEIWFFDEETSTLNVRILGISPLRDVFDENGNFKYELPMFWVYYPEAREVLARHRVFNEGNDTSPISWEDLFEMRFFSSYIYQQADVKGRRLKSYLSGVDLLLEADKIREEIFNWEHDLWTY